MQQNRSPEQLVQQALAELPRIREELGKPVGSNNQQGQPAQNVAPIAPNQQNIEAHKQRLQGAAYGRLSTTMLTARERLHVQRTAQEAIAQVSFATAAAQETALQERLIHKSGILDQARSKCVEIQGELGTLQEIRQLQEHKKQKAADYEKACKDLQFLQEKNALDDKVHQLNNHLSLLDFELTREIMAAQEIIHALKHS